LSELRLRRGIQLDALGRGGDPAIAGFR
jgi:hypothetical protein